MFKKIVDNLSQSGWILEPLPNNWVCATHATLRRGLLFGTFSELPLEFKPLIRNYSDFSQWDAIIFCPEGIDSSDLKQRRYPGIQLWYWDMPKGNLFPFPPTKNHNIPHWLRQVTSGNQVFLEGDSKSEKRFHPFLTYSILIINLIIFLLMTLAGGSEDERVLILFGAKVNSLIQAGQIWRLFTSIFLHIGYMHLIFNLYALWAIGPLTEKIFGHRRFSVIYILSGLGGSIASYLFTTALSAGASGAIFGLLGALLYYCLKRPYLWKSGLVMNLIIIIAINFGFGLYQTGIDNFAHLGGLTTGIFTSIIFSKSTS